MFRSHFSEMILLTFHSHSHFSDSQETKNTALILESIEPKSFELLIEYLYSKRVPGVAPDSSPTAQAERIFFLCKLYCFADGHDFQPPFLEKVLAAVDEGFQALGRSPE